ncbi:hypothetical protein AURDEDRAFT_174075 [Auricularia subglabra TFB-10046 SS5]|nr:hypothetical protein AURDEDRAFT_174075 [Auricularia subglabra TFB-10046 SS5]
MAFDGFLTRFLLEQTPSLVDLELLTDGTWTGEPVVGLHNVHIMRVCLLDLELAAHLVKGRPVTHLQVTTASLHDTEVAEIAREWRGSVGPVRAFTVDFGDEWVDPGTLRTIGDAFPSLRLLGIVPLEYHEVASEAAAGAAGRGADSVLGALAGMRELRTLLINNREGEIENPAQSGSCQ